MATILVLEKTNKINNNNLVDLVLTRYSEQGKKLSSLVINSGQGYNQTFLKAGQGVPSNYAPVEEGYYDLGPLEWAGGKNNYNALFPAGISIGPIWVDILPSIGNPTRRSAIGIHLDGNRDVAPGTMGCLGIKTLSDLKILTSWWDDAYGDPTKLIVDWGLGTVKKVFIPENDINKLKIFYHSSKLSSFLNDRPKQWSLVKLMQNNGKIGGVINYDEVDLLSVELKVVYKKK